MYAIERLSAEPLMMHNIGLVLINGDTYTSYEDPKSRYSLHGRGTITLLLRQSSDSAYTAILKTSFPSENRLSEVEAIKKCKELTNSDIMILHDIPNLLASEDFTDFSTSKIRRLLNIFHEGRSRVPRALIFDILVPLTQLKGQEFLVAFLDILRCHFLLWRLGIEHGDISVSNLMYNERTQKGILNDWDLATYRFLVTASVLSLRRDRTASMPFVALQLLDDAGWKGEIRRLYRHDLESFAWVLFWICSRFSNGQEQRRGPLEAFITKDHEECFSRKKSLVVADVAATNDYALCWFPAVRMINYWQKHHNQKTFQRSERAVFLAMQASGGGTKLPSTMDELPEEDDSYHLQQMLQLLDSTDITYNFGIQL
ncbi:hypothetical protein C8J56DRAFT_1161612 [Mycena floridula]|nr:hypothetical protein C8J56DRAFT_1161612 [Mycena floridula]